MKLRAMTFNAAAAAAMLVASQVPAQAQRGESCNDLWHRRNSIYASFGYCFQTQRAIAAFGRGCFPPYGRMPADAAREVARLQAIEARRGCPA
jgi:YARHG domain